ncbi:type II/IV secretion system protein [Candidatus Sumerlaeota bacterium]|nr:type II/IV secretion system protein [Candidatus Sumerlaeota bacterium]
MDTRPNSQTETPASPQGESGTHFDPRSFSVASIASSVARPYQPPESMPFDPTSMATKPKTPFALGVLLEEAGLINKEMIDDLIASGQESAQSLKRSLIQQGLVSEEDILDAIADDLGVERTSLRQVEVTPELLEQIAPAFAKKHRVFPISYNDEEIVIALNDPTNVGACDDLQMATGKRIVPKVVPEAELDRYIAKYYEGDEVGKIYDEFTKDTANPFVRGLGEYETIDLDHGVESVVRPEVRFVDLVFRQAVHEGASDIHIEPSRTGLKVRFRTDGVLAEIPQPPRKWQNAIISRLKVLSGMDLAEKRIPQDGRIKLTLPNKKLDLRVSCLPSIFGETIVMRILDQSDVLMGLEDVGFLPDSIRIFERLIRTPNGVILMTGPTGSGKTTTLNSALSVLNSPERKIITVEDPVEYQIQGINQIQANHEVGLDFGMALRTMLRMSPDVIMVGEIRDRETGDIAIRAALTGHLVFSTLHTNDAPSATIRLIEMGIKPFLVASSIQAVIAQRLIRRVCSRCKSPTSLAPDVIVQMGYDPKDYVGTTFYKGIGCDRCSDGYRGRTAIHEIFEMNPDLRKMVIQVQPTIKIKKAAIGFGMRTLRQDGWEKVLLGITSVEEVMRMTQMD